MSTTKINKTQAGDGIWTRDTLKEGNNIELVLKTNPYVLDTETVGCWHFNNSLEDAYGSNDITNTRNMFYSDTGLYKFGHYSLRLDAEGNSIWNEFKNKITLNYPFTIDFWLVNSANSMYFTMGDSVIWYYGPSNSSYATTDSILSINSTEFKFKRGSKVLQATLDRFEKNTPTHIAISADENGLLHVFQNGIIKGTADFGGMKDFVISNMASGNTLGIDELRITRKCVFTDQFSDDLPTDEYEKKESEDWYVINHNPDTALSDTSKNTVQNKVVKAALDTKLDIDSASSTYAAKADVYTKDDVYTKAEVDALIDESGEEPAAPTVTHYTGNIGGSITIPSTSSATLVKVYKNGMLLRSGFDYTINGTTLGLENTNLSLTDVITLEVF